MKIQASKLHHGIRFICKLTLGCSLFCYVVLLLQAFMLSTILGAETAISREIWAYNKYAQPVATDIAIPRMLHGSPDCHITFDPASMISGAQVNERFYGVGAVPTQMSPSSSRMAALNLGFARLGGSQMSRYDFETHLLRQRIHRDPNDTSPIDIRYETAPSWLEMVQFSRNLGMEPIVQVNLLGFKPTYDNTGKPVTIAVDPAREAAKFLKYLNKTNRLNVKYLAMDNEPTLWAETHFDLVSDYVSADQYIDRYFRSVLALREAAEEIHGDPNFIRIIGPEDSQTWGWFQTGAKADGCVWNTSTKRYDCTYGRGSGRHFENFLEYFLYKIARLEKDRSRNPRGYKLLDYFSFHAYPLFRYDYFDPNSFLPGERGIQDPSRYLRSIRLWHTDDVNTTDQVFPTGRPINFFKFVHRLLRKHYPHAKLAITEFNIDSSGKVVQYHPAIRPLYIAEMSALAAKNGVEIFNLSYLNSTEYEPHSWSLISRGSRVIPAYYAMALMSQHFRGAFIRASTTCQSVPQHNVVTYGVRHGNKSALLVINKDEVKEVKSRFVRGQQPVLDVTIPELTMALIVIDEKGARVMRFGQRELKVRLRN